MTVEQEQPRQSIDRRDLVAIILGMAGGVLIGVGGFLLTPWLGCVLLGFWFLGAALLLGFTGEDVEEEPTPPPTRSRDRRAA